MIYREKLACNYMKDVDLIICIKIALYTNQYTSASSIV
jgi:hypothetical protein